MWRHGVIMGKRALIEAWRSGHCHGYRISEVKKELEQLGFAVTQGTKHWKARHPELDRHPDFGMRMLTISAHAYGNSGEVHPKALVKVVKALE